MNASDREYLDAVFADLGRTDSKYGHPTNERMIRRFYPGSDYATRAQQVDAAMREALERPERFNEDGERIEVDE